MVCQPVDWVRPLPRCSDHVGEVFVGLSGYVSFQAPHDLWGGESFVSSACHIGSGFGVAAHPGEDDAVEGGVGLTVSSPVQPVACHFP